MKTLLHVDMDAFFASVELLAHPEWRGKPLVVGSDPHERGVVSTCSYEARKYGIHSAMPSRTAYQLCPHAIFTRPNMALYEEVSRKAFEVFETFTPYVEGVSIDEAFLDITGSIHLYGDARTLGDALRKKIEKECSVTCSVGIAPNRLLAKIGSEENKPNGLTIMPFDEKEIASFLAPKPISVIWGVGGKTAALLKRYGLTTCGTIQRTSVDALEKILGSRNAAESLKSHSFGISDNTVYWQDRDEKSVSNESTFGEDECSREAVRTTLLELAAKVGRRFRSEKRWARTLRIKMRSAAFETISRQIPFDEPSRDDFTIRAKALELFEMMWPNTESQRIAGRAIRLIGIGLANIQNTPHLSSYQDDLFGSDEGKKREKRERLSEAMDALYYKGNTFSSFSIKHRNSE